MKYIDNITALILAGGLGTRLSSVVSDRPKVLAPVNGRPFLSYLLDQLVSAGFRDVILCTGYKGEMIRETFGDNYKNLTISYSQEPEPLGTGGALRYALPMIEQDTVLAMNGDSYCPVNISDFYTFHCSKGGLVSMAVVEAEDVKDYGLLALDDSQRITSFEEKKHNSGKVYINAGIYFFEKSVLAGIPQGIKYSLEEEFFPFILGKSFFGYVVDGEVLDIGTFERYKFARKYFSS